MGVTVGELQVEIKGELDQLRSSFRKVEGDVKRFTTKSNKAIKSFERTTSKALRAFKGLAAGFIGGFGVAILVRGVTQAIGALDKLAKTADKIGFTTTSLQELRFGAELTGNQVAALDVGLQRFVRRVGEAAQGTGEARAALAELGIAVTFADGRLRNTDDVLDDVADGLQAVTSQTDRVRLAFKLFDTEGVGLVNLLKNGKIGLDEFREAAREAGVVINEETVREAERLNDQLTTLQRGLQGDFQRAFVNFGPVLEAFATGVRDIGDAITIVSNVFTKLETQSTESLKVRSVELSTRRAELQALIDRPISTTAKVVGTLFPGVFEATQKATERELARIIEAEARVDELLAIRRGPAPGRPEEEGELGAVVAAPGEEAAKVAEALAKEQEKSLMSLLALERQITIAKLDRVEPLNAELAAIADQVKAVQDLDVAEKDREARTRVLVSLGEEAARIQTKITQGGLDQLSNEIELERKLERSLELDRERALAIERAVRLRLAEAIGVEATNEALRDALKDLDDLITEEEAEDAAESIGKKIGESVESGIVTGLVGAAKGGGIDSFVTAFQGLMDDALTATFTDLVSGLGDQLKEAFKDIDFGGGEGGGGLGAGFAAAIGLGGAVLGGALAKTSQSQTFSPLVSDTAVTSTQEVRGIVAGPTNIPIKTVGNNLKEAQRELTAEVKAIRALVQQGVADARVQGGGGSVDDAVASDLNGSPALA